MLVPVLFFNALMFVGAMMVFRVLAHASAHDGQPPDWRTAIGLGATGFIWGRVSVWGLVELVEKLVPLDENLAILAFWWPVLVGFVMILGPSLILRFAEERFQLRRIQLRRPSKCAASLMSQTSPSAHTTLQNYEGRLTT